MASFKKTNVKVFSKIGPELTPDNIYWKKFSAPVLVKEYGPIDYIDFSPAEPYHFAVTCSARVQVYNPITKEVTKNLSRFKEAAYGGSFRKDGKLLCAGGEEASVRLFEVSSRSLLRLFTGHKAPVHRSFFTGDGIRIVSFSDDKTTALWDIPSERQILSFNEHTDYIRAGAVSPVSPDIFASGSYDRTVNLYDTRTDTKIFSVNHDAPVESVLFLPSGGIVLSAGGTEIKVWDSLAGGKLLARLSNHHKTITCLTIASNGHKILSGSLDRHVKVYDTGTYKVVHTLDYPNSVLSLGISKNDETIVAGMVDGVMSIRRREDDSKNEKPKRVKASFRHVIDKNHLRSLDAVIPEESKQVLGKYDVWLRKFQFSKALDEVMKPYVMNKHPHVTVALLSQLMNRQCLNQALAGRDGKSLVNILKFLIKHIGSIRFGRVVLHVTNVLMDVYEDHLEELSSEPRTMFNILSKKLGEEEELTLTLTELQGQLQMILSAAERLTPSTAIDPPSLEPSSAAQKNLVLSIA